MMKKDLSTEEKIKEAARKLFHQKGYAATRTRDIANEAGINLALLNYYYRSKEKLFELVMEEGIDEIFTTLKNLLNDDTHSLGDKMNIVVNKYIDVISENSNLPMFVLGEIRANPEKFKKKLGLSESVLANSILHKQLEEQMKKMSMANINPMHIIINILSMTIFPFIGKPLLLYITGMNETAFCQFIEERRTLIPLWIKSMLNLDEKLKNNL